MLLDQSSCNPDGLTSSFGWSGRDEVVQHDVQELNRVLFSAIEQHLVGTSGFIFFFLALISEMTASIPLVADAFFQAVT